MDKNILKERLAEIKNQLRTNSKDAHFFDKLIDEALSLKGQLSITPIACGFFQDEVVDTYEDDTYRIIAGKNTSAYETKGGYTVVCENKMGLGGLLYMLATEQKSISEIEGEQKENLETYLSALAYSLNVPLFAANDQEFMYKIASEMLSHIKKITDEAFSKELQEETHEENNEFKEASLTMHELGEMDLIED